MSSNASVSPMPLVSVVLPVRNGARFIREALHSVLAQDHRPIEVTVVDAASTDGTREIVEEHADAGVRLLDQQGGGIAAAWNQGIAASEGPLLAFVSSDDRWLPGKLTRQVEVMLAEPELQYAITHFQYFLEPGCAIPPTFNRALLGVNLVGRIMETLVARREAFDTIGWFDTDFRTAEDVDWYARAKDLGVPMRVLPEVFLEKRVHDHNVSMAGERNMPHLMAALQRSIERRRGAGS
jgi:glycosyltransferase involved in cell wall biosynthesis